MKRDTEKRKRHRVHAARRELRKTQRVATRVSAVYARRSVAIESWTREFMLKLARSFIPIRRVGLERVGALRHHRGGDR